MHQQQSRKYRHSFMLLRKEYPMLDPIQFLYLGNGRDMLLRACPMENGTKGRRGSAWHSGGSRVSCLPKGIMLWRRVSGGPIYQLPVPSTRPGGGGGAAEAFLCRGKAGTFCNLCFCHCGNKREKRPVAWHTNTPLPQ